MRDCARIADLCSSNNSPPRPNTSLMLQTVCGYQYLGSLLGYARGWCKTTHYHHLPFTHQDVKQNLITATSPLRTRRQPINYSIPRIFLCVDGDWLLCAAFAVVKTLGMSMPANDPKVRAIRQTQMSSLSSCCQHCCATRWTQCPLRIFSLYFLRLWLFFSFYCFFKFYTKMNHAPLTTSWGIGNLRHLHLTLP